MIAQDKQNQGEIIAGIDTHKNTYAVAVCDNCGKIVSNAQFSTAKKGIKELVYWLCSQGCVLAVGIEGTGSYGKNIAQKLQEMQIRVIEVTHPVKSMRRSRGKSDELDAQMAARSTYDFLYGGPSENNACIAKDRSKEVEEIRLIATSHEAAVKECTQVCNQLKSAIVGAPAYIREELRELSSLKQIQKCAKMRICAKTRDMKTKMVLRNLAQRILNLKKEIADYKTILEEFAKEYLPSLFKAVQVGPVAAVQIFLSAGANINRFKSEAAFAAHCGIAPLPASSGMHSRMRLSRAGDRKANSVYYMIAIGRMGHDEKTKNYVQRRLAEGKRKKEIIRCLKRYIVRETFHLLRRDLKNFYLAS